MEINNEKVLLHYNINLNYDKNGRDLYQIIKDHFLLYIKQLKKNENVNQKCQNIH